MVEEPHKRALAQKHRPRTVDVAHSFVQQEHSRKVMMKNPRACGSMVNMSPMMLNEDPVLLLATYTFHFGRDLLA